LRKLDDNVIEEIERLSQFRRVDAFTADVLQTLKNEVKPFLQYQQNVISVLSIFPGFGDKEKILVDAGSDITCVCYRELQQVFHNSHFGSVKVVDASVGGLEQAVESLEQKYDLIILDEVFNQITNSSALIKGLTAKLSSRKSIVVVLSPNKWRLSKLLSLGFLYDNQHIDLFSSVGLRVWLGGKSMRQVSKITEESGLQAIAILGCSLGIRFSWLTKFRKRVLKGFGKHFAQTLIFVLRQGL
jgi:hypothetical protein